MKDIAILIDSGTDVPQEYIDRYGMFMLPLGINYEALSYRDRVDITTEQVIDRLELEIPQTSLPSVGEAVDTLRRIRAMGVRQVLAVTISSGLSGTYSMLRMVAKEFEDMEIHVLDSKNIGIGAGIFAIRAAELAEKGASLREIEKTLSGLVGKTRVFFCVDTLKYLQKGGRIGLVTAAVGTLLGIHPIISCNEDGVYYTVRKVRGAKAALDATVEQVVQAAKGQTRFDLFVAHGGAAEKAKIAVSALEKRISGFQNLILAPVSPALVVHSGPGLLGVGIQVY